LARRPQGRRHLIRERRSVSTWGGISFHLVDGNPTRPFS
jgi:hypothetical protein